MLSEQAHLRQSLNQCGYRNSIINHAISFNKRHNTKTDTSIQKNKCYVSLPYKGELSEKMKQLFQDYDISTMFRAVCTLKNSLVHPSRQSNVLYEICCNPNFACQDAYIGETSQQLQHCLRQLCRSSFNGNDSAVFKHINLSGYQIYFNDVTILAR